MLRVFRKFIDRNSYHNRTQKLLNYRNIVHSSLGLKRFIYVRKYNKMCMSFGGDIPLETKIGEGLVLPHGANGIYISRGAIIGKNCVIFQQVTIGSNTLQDSKNQGAPIIGDNAYIGAGAKIIGGIKIGNNVRIGANAVIVQDVPDNTTVVLNRPKLITKKQHNNSFNYYKV